MSAGCTYTIFLIMCCPERRGRPGSSQYTRFLLFVVLDKATPPLFIFFLLVLRCLLFTRPLSSMLYTAIEARSHDQLDRFLAAQVLLLLLGVSELW